ncbi:MAG: DNA mismatch repair endonuclease MutH [Pseudomonadota bacterium]
MSRVPPPRTEAELLAGATSIGGLTLAELAHTLGSAIPSDSTRAKGWSGELLEAALGAAGTSEPEPDFPNLGIELKTVPISPNGRSKESTHVCVVPLEPQPGLRWEDSLVCRKLARVLFVPLLSPPNETLGERVVCAPLLWSPTSIQAAKLRRDWEELMEYIAFGRAHELTAHQGDWLQIRPKAANARSTGWTSDPAGRRVPTNPRGFYLRSSFTTELLKSHFILPGNG